MSNWKPRLCKTGKIWSIRDDFNIVVFTGSRVKCLAYAMGDRNLRRQMEKSK